MGAPPKIISVASGKGGVGKTNVTLNLAWALARLGHSVCIFDADLGLSNVDVLLGLRPERTLDQVLFEGLPLSQVITPVATGIDLVPGSSGVARMAELTRAARTRLVREFTALSGYDYMLVDNSPGITPQVLALCLAAQELVVVVNPEVTSLTDAYALIKVLHGRGLSWPPLVLINRAQNPQAAELAFRRIQATAQKHLKLNCTYLGHLPEDASVARASALQRCVLEVFPQSAFAQAVTQAAGRLAGSARLSFARAVDPSRFWGRTLLALQQTPAVSAQAGARGQGATPETQAMLRDVEAMRALFARLNFKGAPEPLRRIAEAGTGHARNLIAALKAVTPGVLPLPRPAPAQKAALQVNKDSAAVLVRCANQDMGQIVSDILREMRLTPLLSTNGRTAQKPGRAALCILAAPARTPAMTAYLKALGDIPVLILDESFGRNRSAWLDLPGVGAVLPVPFELPEFIRTIETLLLCEKGGASASCPRGTA